MKTINGKLKREQFSEVLAETPALLLVIALARHRAFIDHTNAKLTTDDIKRPETIVFETIT